MNRFLNYFLSMTMIAALLVVTGCGEDVDPIDETLQPTVELAGADALQTTFDVGEEVNLTFNFSTPQELSSFNYTVIVDGVEQAPVFNNPETDLGLTANETAGAINFALEIPAAWEGSEVSMVFEVVDKESQSAEVVYDFTVNEQEVIVYNAVLLAAPTEDQTNEVWFSTSTGLRYSTEEVNSTTENLSSLIDFGYRYGPSAGATLASPAAYPAEGNQTMTAWSALNETMLRRVSTGVTEAQFLEMGNSAAAIETAYEEGTAGTNPQRLAGLQEGEVLAFMTDADKNSGSQMGLIYVEEIFLGADGSGFGSDAYISLNIKVTE